MGIRLESEHASDDELELYVLNLLQDDDLNRIEEHLLGCSLCVGSAEQLVEEISLLRLALRDYIASQDDASLPNRTVPVLKHSRSDNGMLVPNHYSGTSIEGW
jgi:anti-sigma factor RsiW